MAGSERWEVRWLHFDDGASFEEVSEALAQIPPYWEPFAAMPNREKGEGWVLLLRRKVAVE